jgi:hypothetical protein
MNVRFNHTGPCGADIRVREGAKNCSKLLDQPGGLLLSRKNGTALMLGVAVGIALLMLRLPPIPQSATYHQFADQRRWLGIPNFLNVVSNVAFAIVGLYGIAFMRRESGTVFQDPRERWPYLGIFVGLFLTAFGSAYYHLAPSNAHLVWDRLPMTIVFGSLLAALITERIDVLAGVRLLPWLVVLGAGSVLQWYWDERHGHGDLRIYAAVQLYSALALLLALLLPPRYPCSRDLAGIFVFYLLAKVFETADRRIYSLGHIISGHTLKHLAAAAAGYWILRMLRLRAPAAANSSAVNTAALS